MAWDRGRRQALGKRGVWEDGWIGFLKELSVDAAHDGERPILDCAGSVAGGASSGVTALLSCCIGGP